MRRFLLDSGGVADDQCRRRGVENRVAIAHWRDEIECRMRLEASAYGCRNARVGMDGEEHAQVRPRDGDRDQSVADNAGVAVMVLAPMQRDQDSIASSRRGPHFGQQHPQAVDTGAAHR